MKCSICEKQAEYQTDGKFLSETFPCLCREHYKQIVKMDPVARKYYYRIPEVKENVAVEAK